MKCASRSLVFLVLLIVLAGLFAGCKHMTGYMPEARPLKAGAAEIDITPPPGHRMAGYFDERLATGTHDPLKAKALVVRQGLEEIALVFCDLVGVSLNVTKAARAEASRQTGIPIKNIVIAGTHRHTGPLFDDTRRNYFHQSAIEK